MREDQSSLPFAVNRIKSASVRMPRRPFADCPTATEYYRFRNVAEVAKTSGFHALPWARILPGYGRNRIRLRR